GEIVWIGCASAGGVQDPVQTGSCPRGHVEVAADGSATDNIDLPGANIICARIGEGYFIKIGACPGRDAEGQNRYQYQGFKGFHCTRFAGMGYFRANPLTAVKTRWFLVKSCDLTSKGWPGSGPQLAANSDPWTALPGSFNNPDLDGIWTLFVADLGTNCQSTPVGWSIEIVTGPGPTTVRFLATFGGLAAMGTGSLPVGQSSKIHP